MQSELGESNQTKDGKGLIKFACLFHFKQIFDEIVKCELFETIIFVTQVSEKGIEGYNLV